MGSNEHDRWARVAAGREWQHPGLPRSWCRLFATHPDTTVGRLPGYGWLEGPTKLLHVRLEWLEIRDTPPEGDG